MYTGSDPERTYSVVGYRLDGYDGEGREDAIRVLRELSKPAPRRACLKELARLKVLTKAAKQGDLDIELTLEIFADEMEKYPLDVVRDTCRAWPQCPGGKFFPAWCELKPMLDERFLKRKALLNALRKWARLQGEGKP